MGKPGSWESTQGDDSFHAWRLDNGTYMVSCFRVAYDYSRRPHSRPTPPLSDLDLDLSPPPPSDLSPGFLREP
jgi:hypothetical protein